MPVEGTEQGTGQAIKHGRADMAELLARWLQARLGPDARITDLHAPESTGYSSETVMYRVDWTGEDGPRSARHVLRTRPPGDITVFPAYDLEAQARCMERVAEHGDVPVPTVIAYEPDEALLGHPFLVMEHVDGQVPDDNPPFTMMGWLHDAPAPDQQRLYTSALTAMSGLHRLERPQADFSFLDAPVHGPTGTGQQLEWWRAMLEWGRDDRPQPTIEAGFRWLDAHFPREQPPVGLTWGDARVSNMIFQDFEPVALLDWEMASLGPAEIDLAWFIYMNQQFADGLNCPQLPGFLDEPATVDLYADLIGRDLADLTWYRIFAGVRFALTMMRIGLGVIADGVVESDADVDRNNLATRFLAQQLDLPSPGEPGLMG